jgi:predicted kinase
VATLFIPIGTSGAGKTTMFNKLKESNPQLEQYSWDVLRHRWYDPVNYKHAWELSTQDGAFGKKINDEYLKMLDEAKDLYIDNMNLSPKKRKWFLEEAKKRNYKTVAIVFPNVTLEMVIERQKTRGDKNVPEAAVRQQWMALKGPMPGEFDSIVTA